jgi:hypothetical protein
MDAKNVPVERHAQQVFSVFAKPIVTPISQLAPGKKEMSSPPPAELVLNS